MSAPLSSVPESFRQAVLSALPEDGSCVDKSFVVAAAQRAEFNDKKRRDRHFEILTDIFEIGKIFVPTSTELLFRVTKAGPKKLPLGGFVISGVPPHYCWDVATASSADEIMDHGPLRGDEPAFRQTVIDYISSKVQEKKGGEPQEDQVLVKLRAAKWYNKTERERFLQKMVDDGALDRKGHKIGLPGCFGTAHTSAVSAQSNNNSKSLCDAIVSILPKDGSCVLLTNVAQSLISEGYKDRDERAVCIDSLIKSFVVGKAASPPTDTWLFLVTEDGPKLPPRGRIVSKVPPQYASLWKDRASKQTKENKNSSGNVGGDAQVVSHQSFFPPPPPPSSSYTSSALPPPPMMKNTSLSNNSVASVKTATKLYFENIKDLVPSEGLEKSSVMVLMGHQHGWKDQNMQQEFLDELSSKGLVQLRSDPANPGLIKLFCTSSSEQHQQQLSQPPSIVNGPQRRTRSPDVTPNVNSSNTGSYYSQYQPQQQREVVRVTPIFSGQSPLTVPPPQLVRNGQPLHRTNLSVLMKMPPPFKVERSYYY